VANDGILGDPLEIDRPARRRPDHPMVEARPGLIVTDRASGVVGSLVRFGNDLAVLRDERGRNRTFHARPGMLLVDGVPVSLVHPRAAPVAETRTTPSGSVAAPDTRPRVARPSRLWVEGVHDAELLELVWGDDLRAEGVVVEPIGGIDDLVAAVRAFGPRPGRRLGILVDHLVEGTKEHRIAAAIDHPDVLVTGHPYVDVWQAIRPSVLGIGSWPVIPLGQDWKTGVCRALGASDPPTLWRTIRNRVSTYADLEPGLVGAVEQLLDFVVDTQDLDERPER
jgi:hypothetical protein